MPTEDSSIPIRAVLSAFRRRWFLSVSVGLLLGAAAAAGAWHLIPAPYTAFSELRISAVQPRILFETSEARAEFDTYKQTQMTLIKYPIVLTAALRNEEVSRSSLLRDEADPEKWLEENISVTSPGAEFIRISLSGDNPEEPATIVNAVTESYLEVIVFRERKQRLDRLADLGRYHSRLADELDGLRSRLEEMAKESRPSNSVQATQKQEAVLKLHLQMSKELARIKYDKINAEIQLAVRRKQGREPDRTDPSAGVISAHIESHPAFRKAEARVEQLEHLVGRNEETLSPNHPRLAESRNELEQAKQKLDAVREELRPEVVQRLMDARDADSEPGETELEERIKHLGAVAEQLEQRLDEVKIKERELGVASNQIDQIMDQIAFKEPVVNSLATEMQRLEIEKESPVRVDESFRKAKPPVEPDLKTKIAGTGLAGLGGFGLFVAGIVFLECRARRISSLDEVAAGLSMRVMGTLPQMPRSAIHGRRRKSGERTAYWHNALTESIDSVRTMLLHAAQAEGLQVVMLSSATAGEGKTTISCHLATSLARAGRRVLLVDCDMRRPSVQKVFDVPLTPGFCEVLGGEARPEEAIRPTSRNGLSILPAGRISQRILQVLARNDLARVFEELKKEFEFIIVDSSPVLPVTDSLLIAQHVDGVVFSIRRDISRTAKIVAAGQRLSMLGVPILGAVAIGLDDGSYGFRFDDRSGYGDHTAYESS